MSLEVLFLPEANEELTEAALWYENRCAGLGKDFASTISKSLEEIGCFPVRSPEFLFSTRRYLLARFPYCLVYKMIGDVIWIVAVAHTSRRPGYWKERF